MGMESGHNIWMGLGPMSRSSRMNSRPFRWIKDSNKLLRKSSTCDFVLHPLMFSVAILINFTSRKDSDKICKSLLNHLHTVKFYL